MVSEFSHRSEYLKYIKIVSKRVSFYTNPTNKTFQVRIRTRTIVWSQGKSQKILAVLYTKSYKKGVVRFKIIEGTFTTNKQ